MRLVEVEAYLGPTDPACHTFGGRRTPRVATMWGDAGHVYVYFTYGMHHCLNVVTVGGGAGEAVLVRGGAVVHGHELACRRRGSTVAERSLADGPGKLCQALAIARGDDGRDLCDPRSGLWLCDDGLRPAPGSVRRGTSGGGGLRRRRGRVAAAIHSGRRRLRAPGLTASKRLVYRHGRCA